MERKRLPAQYDYRRQSLSTMEEKSRGFSLRQKKSSRRPPISAPRQIPSNLNPATPSLGRVNGNGDNSAGSHGTEKTVARPRPKLEGGTSDIVKRRYSTRFTTVPKFTADGAPSVPALPTSSFHSAQSQQVIPSSSHQTLSVDQGALRETGLDADQYAKSILSEASDQELREYQATLLKIKNRTSSDLQQNVYQNRTQFIKISKEAEKLKGEMRTLRGLMSELSSSLSQASVGFSVLEPRAIQEDGASRARKLANRSSLANLEAMWTVQLHTLWKNVEGSQKFLPAIPGRHVLHESGYWVELDAATWKVRRPAHIFLLNDHLLVATKKKKQVESTVIMDGNEAQKSSAKLIADNCWPLQDIDMIDITSSSSVGDKKVMSNAISIRHGHKSFTYRFDKPSSSEKANLLLAFRRAADELRKSLRTETEETNTRVPRVTDNFTARDLALSKKPDLMQIMNNSKDRSEILIEVDGKHQNLRWVESRFDELDSEIALQKFEDAVRHVEKFRRIARGLKNNTLAQELIAMKVDERARRLADFIVQRLIDTHSYLKATQTHIAWLVRLEFDEKAREEFLRARSSIISKRSRQILFEGNLHRHIFQISFVYFTLIKNTVHIYQQCFPPLMMSACVKWAKEHLDHFNNILASQLSNVQHDSPTWQECMDRAREHAKMMDEVGLDFKDLVGINSEKEGDNNA